MYGKERVFGLPDVPEDNLRKTGTPTRAELETKVVDFLRGQGAAYDEYECVWVDNGDGTAEFTVYGIMG